MTIEEKAKAYDEALKWMRELYPGLHGATKEDAEHYFPELRESDDEGIRKLLIWQVHRNIEDETNDLAQSVYDGIKGHDPDLEESIEDWKKCLAWLEKQNHDGKKWITPAELNRLETLRYEAGYKAGFNVGVHSEAEKQKEQKPAQTDDEKEYIRTIKSIISDFIRDKKPKDVAYYQRIYNWLDGRHIEQKPYEPKNWPTDKDNLTQEQKPAEKEITLNGFEKVLDSFLFDFVHSPIIDCEPKEYIKNHSAYLLKAAYKELNAQLKQDFFEAQQEGRREGYEAAMAEQKPKRERKKPKESWLEKAKYELAHEEELLIKRQKEMSEIRALKNKEQKPLEWSEEDEAMIKSILFVLESYVSHSESASSPSLITSYPTYYKEIDWLKSLRPQPHEEIYQSAKRDLAIKFMNYLDENRPDGKMCLSNAESEDIDKAFKENDWAKIMRYADKYLPHWKPSDEQEEPEYYQHFDPDC